MRFGVIGAGAVGGYLGGRLLQSGEDVVFLARRSRKEELLRRGLRIRSPLGDSDLTVAVEEDAEEVGECDVVVVAVKNFDLGSALGAVGKLGRGGASVVSVLNGVEHIERILSVVGREQIVGGPLYIEATLGPEGQVIHRSVAPHLTLGSLAESPNRANPVATAFDRAGIKTSVSPDLLGEFWRKNIFITVFSGVTSLARRPIGAVLADERAARLVTEMTSEAVDIAHAAEPSLRSLTVDEIIRRTRSMPPTMTSSMHQDLEKGLPLEVESLQGYMVRKAEEFGLEVPVLSTCYGILRLFEKGSTRQIRKRSPSTEPAAPDGPTNNK